MHDLQCPKTSRGEIVCYPGSRDGAIFRIIPVSMHICSTTYRLGHARRGGKPEFKLERFPPSYVPSCSPCSIKSLADPALFPDLSKSQIIGMKLNINPIQENRISFSLRSSPTTAKTNPHNTEAATENPKMIRAFGISAGWRSINCANQPQAMPRIGTPNDIPPNIGLRTLAALTCSILILYLSGEHLMWRHRRIKLRFNLGRYRRLPRMTCSLWVFVFMVGRFSRCSTATRHPEVDLANRSKTSNSKARTSIRSEIPLKFWNSASDPCFSLGTIFANPPLWMGLPTRLRT